MILSRGQEKAQRVAERVDEDVDLGAQSALAAADRLIIIFFGCANAVLVGPHDDAVDHRMFIVGIGGQVLEHALPDPVVGPATEPPMRVLPVAEALRQVAPRNPGAVAIENRFDEATIVAGGDTNIPGFSGSRCLIRSHWSSRSPYRFTSQLSTKAGSP
jgi:hypothetical protein